MIYLYASVYCHMQSDIQGNLPAWIENDGVPGPTLGDTVVNSGSQIDLGSKVQLGNCQEW